MKDLTTPGKRTIFSTHDNLCSKQDEGTVNGYALYFEVTMNKQMYTSFFLVRCSRFHVVYRGKHNDCSDFVLEVFEP